MNEISDFTSYKRDPQATSTLLVFSLGNINTQHTEKLVKEREREKQSDRHREGGERERDKQTERQTERKGGRHGWVVRRGDKQTDRHIQREEGEKERKTDRHMHTLPLKF